MGARYLKIYTFSLEELPGWEHSPHATPKLVCDIPGPHRCGHFSDSVIYENLVAVTVLQYSSSQAVIINTATGFWTVVQPQFPSVGFPSVSLFSIFPRSISFLSSSLSRPQQGALHYTPSTSPSLSRAEASILCNSTNFLPPFSTLATHRRHRSPSHNPQ
jgi:hypothetical protein